MAYSRFEKGVSDVYMLRMDTLVCMSCHMIPEPERYGNDPAFNTRKEAIEHLQEHIAFGHKVHKSTFARLRKEIKEWGNIL